MSIMPILPLAISSAASVLGGGFLGAWMVNRRLWPKSMAEAHEITAAAKDKDFARFHREIARLVARVEKAEEKADAAAAGQRACEEREARLRRQLVAAGIAIN
ncbi:hypothetical protein ACFQ1E_17250 [Sphingomonas canadensis]|uniref:Chemotaxis protein n=1 Tax=Sphingomonas canadensis TaxID=1219257 RepID=A0ABW3HD01_9SPHN|nr:hypothetical protein [Sphingomonas canadensis]MCW3837794.1 hypothetical protein [Sphingomonas canadensis]